MVCKSVLVLMRVSIITSKANNASRFGSGKGSGFTRIQRDKSAHRWKKLHQFLSEIGVKALRTHLGQLLGIAQISRSDREYEKHFQTIFGEQYDLFDEQRLRREALADGPCTSATIPQQRSIRTLPTGECSLFPPRHTSSHATKDSRQSHSEGGAGMDWDSLGPLEPTECISLGRRRR